LGPREAGSVTLDWDGKKKNTMPAGNGNYMLKISATNEQGVEVSTGAVTRTQIVGVSFDGQDPVFIVGDSKRQDRIPMSNVSQIDGGPADVIPDSVKPAAKKMANFFTFKPGEGSKQVDMDQIDPAAAQALERYQQQQLEAKAAPRPSKPVAPQVEEKGFPNGMDVYNTQSKGGEGL